MTESNKQLNTLQLLQCPTCSGFGYIDGRVCATCQQNGLYAWNGSELLYWGKRLNVVAIAQDKLIDIANRSINLALLLFGVSGLGAAVWAVYSLAGTNVPLSNWFSYYTPFTAHAWLTVLSDCYLVFRFQREYEKIGHIPRRGYNSDPHTTSPLTWEGIATVPRSRKTDITGFFTPEAQQAIVTSWKTANKYHDASVNPVHVLISLLSFEQIQVVFGRLGVQFEKLKKKISNVLTNQFPGADEPVMLSRQVHEIIFQSFDLASKLKQRKVDVTEILQALVSQENDVKELLYDLDIDLDKVVNVATWLRIRRQLRARWQHFRARASLRPKNAMNRSMTAVATPMLDTFSQDLTLLARN